MHREVRVKSKKDLARIVRHHASLGVCDLLTCMNRVPAKFRDRTEYLFLVIVLKFGLQPTLRNADWLGIVQAIDELIDDPRCKKYMRPWLMYYKFRCYQQHATTATDNLDCLEQSRIELMPVLGKLPKSIRKQVSRKAETIPLQAAS